MPKPLSPPDTPSLLEERFVLPPDVLIFPVHELADAVRAQVECDEGDFAVTRPRFRTPSRIVDASMARLLDEFRTPTRLVDGLVRYCQKEHLEPEATLESAFPALQALCSGDVLVPEHAPTADALSASHAPGQTVAGFEIVRLVQVLEDTELYQVRASDGRLGALKVMRADALPHQALSIEREAAILRHLDGVAAPRLLDHGSTSGHSFLVTSWCDGHPIADVAASLRRLPSSERLPRLHTLCCAVLEQYAALHAHSVVHGDVHPGNLLATDEGRVRIVDFGIARHLLPGSSWEDTPRAGVGFYYEPEMAKALLHHRLPPPATYLGEQYALGALLYHLITGAHYLDMSLEHEVLCEQVWRDAPLSFVRQGGLHWPEAEAVLRTALQKNPSDRHASVTAFLEAFREARPSLRDPVTHLVRPSSSATAVLEATLAQVQPSPPSLHAVSEPTKKASIAWFLYQVALLREDPALLSAADVWATRAAHEAASPLDQLKCHHVGALLGHALGDPARLYQDSQAFVLDARHALSELEFPCGFVLWVADLLHAALRTFPELDTEPLDTVLDRAITECMDCLDASSPRDADARDRITLLHALLSTAQNRQRLAERLRPIVQTLAEQQRANGVPPEAHRHLVRLWIQAHETYGEEEWVSLAEQAGTSLWNPPACAPDLRDCTEQAWALLRLFQHTGDERWLRRASDRAEQATVLARDAPSDSTAPRNSDLEMALLIAALEHPEQAIIPLMP